MWHRIRGRGVLGRAGYPSTIDLSNFPANSCLTRTGADRWEGRPHRRRATRRPHVLAGCPPPTRRRGRPTGGARSPPWVLLHVGPVISSRRRGDSTLVRLRRWGDRITRPGAPDVGRFAHRRNALVLPSDRLAALARQWAGCSCAGSSTRPCCCRTAPGATPSSAPRPPSSPSGRSSPPSCCSAAGTGRSLPEASATPGQPQA